MENATKALLIAAGVFFVLMIISLFVATYDDISAYYESKHKATVIEQVKEFNAKFENFNRNDIRGSELISLMNRVIDYNASQAYDDDKQYERIRVTITLGDANIRKQFKYETDDNLTSQNKYLNKETITNTSGGSDNWKNDKELTAITNTSSEMCDKLQSLDIANVTDTKLQQLASKISNIIVDEDDEKSSMAAYNRLKRVDILKNILGINVGDTADCAVSVDKITGKTKKGQNIINNIKEVASQYYQFMQFKRAYFDCTEVIYDTDTDRVVEMNFKLQVKDGVVIFN